MITGTAERWRSFRAAFQLSCLFFKTGHSFSQLINYGRIQVLIRAVCRFKPDLEEVNVWWLLPFCPETLFLRWCGEKIINNNKKRPLRSSKMNVNSLLPGGLAHFTCGAFSLSALVCPSFCLFFSRGISSSTFQPSSCTSPPPLLLLCFFFFHHFLLLLLQLVLLAPSGRRRSGSRRLCSCC